MLDRKEFYYLGPCLICVSLYLIHLIYSLFFPFLPLCRKLIIWVDRPLPLWALQVRQIITLLCKQSSNLLTLISACMVAHTQVHVKISAFSMWVSSIKVKLLALSDVRTRSHHCYLIFIYTCGVIPRACCTRKCVQSDTGLCLASLKPFSLWSSNISTPTDFHPRSPSLRLLISLCSGLSLTISTPLRAGVPTIFSHRFAPSVFSQVLVAFISFSETMLLVYLSYKVSYSRTRDGCLWQGCLWRVCGGGLGGRFAWDTWGSGLSTLHCVTIKLPLPFLQWCSTCASEFRKHLGETPHHCPVMNPSGRL